VGIYFSFVAVPFRLFFISINPHYFFNSLQVKEDENVVVGHIIAVIDDSGEASSASSSSPAAEAQKQEAPPSTSDKKKMPPTQAAAPAPQKTAASNDTHGRGRTPSIKFPPRRTSTGNIISMLPAAEAAAVAAAAVENTLEISRPVRMTESPHKSQLFIRVPLRSSEPDLPPRKELSEWEIENIMLGGAPEMEI